MSTRWALFRVNFKPLQEIKAKYGGGRIFDTGPFFARLRYISATGSQHEFADSKFGERVGRWNEVGELEDMKYIIQAGIQINCCNN